MPQADSIAFNLRADRDEARPRPAPAPARPPRSASETMELLVTSDLAALQDEWRAFERHADCTAFQCYDWLAAWQRHIGALTATVPAIVLGRRGDETEFILPLAVRQRAGWRELTFLGRDLGDYNAPLLAFDFEKRHANFKALWVDIQFLLQANRRYRHDVVFFDKMPERVGAQANPLLQLPVSRHPSSAYLAHLTDDWDTFYAARRSSATRRRDRSKRKRLAEHGVIRLVTPAAPDDRLRTTETLIEQKRRAFARMGVPDLFARPGYRAFFREVATNPRLRPLVHVSELQVGEITAAANLGLRLRDVYYHVLASYDDGPLARFGPGAAHLRELLRHAIEQGCTIFDFTVGDEPYKRDWCDTELKLYDHVAAASARGLAAAVAIAAARAAKRTIKQSPILGPAAVKLRAILGSLKRRRGRR